MSNLKAGGVELQNTLKGIIDGVDAMSSTILKEDDFKQNFLPLVLAVHNGQKPNMHGWVARTGSIYRGFKVVDNVNGTELFTTPGIYVESSFEMEGGLTAMITDVADCQKLKLDPAASYAKHLNSDKATLRLDNGGDHLIAWYKIFARYGYKMQNIETETPIEVTPVKTVEVPALEWADNEFA